MDRLGWEQGNWEKQHEEQRLRDYMAEGTAATSTKPDDSGLTPKSGGAIFVLLALAAFSRMTRRDEVILAPARRGIMLRRMAFGLAIIAVCGGIVTLLFYGLLQVIY